MLLALALASPLLTGPTSAVGDVPWVIAKRKISDQTPGFQDVLEPGDRFGESMADIGDVDGDGISDLAVGAPGDDDGYESGTRLGNRGAVYVLFRRADGSMKARQKISATSGGFTGALEEFGGFGEAVAGLGDVDGDGVPDLAIGAPSDTQGTGQFDGRVWLCFLRRNGTVKELASIELGTPGIGIPRRAAFGSALASAGDWNGDGVPDLLAGCTTRSDLVWLILLGRDGSVLSSRRSNVGLGRSGDCMALVDDLDGDGHRELALSRDGEISVSFLDASGAVLRSVNVFSGVSPQLFAAGDLDGDGRRELFLDYGVNLLLLDLNADGSLASQVPVSTAAFGPGGFGGALAFLGDADANGFPELAGQSSIGIATCTFGPGPSFTGIQRQSDAEGVMEGTLAAGDGFGTSLVAVGDIDGNGVVDLAVGVPQSPATSFGPNGAVWLLLMEADGSVRTRRRIEQRGLTLLLHSRDRFGASLAALGDLDGDGTPDIAVGAPLDDSNQTLNADLGAVWVLFLRPDGSIKAHMRINAIDGGFHGTLHAGDHFGASVAAAGDLDGNGTCDLFVGAPGDDDGGSNRGAVWILHLRRDGSVRFERKLSALEGGFGGSLPDGASFGSGVTAPGDVDGDGQVDLAAGAAGDAAGNGSTWVLFLTRDGSVRAWQRIAHGDGGFPGVLNGRDAFGSALAGPGDLDGDGVPDLVVGAPGDDDVAADAGAAWLLTLERTGRVARAVKVRTGSGGFRGELGDRSFFGTGVAVLGDVSGDGVPELLVGAPGADGARPDHGAVWLLALDALAVLDFEHRSDFTPTLDGLALPSGTALGPLVTLHEQGSNLGPALFDSRPGGPNDPSQDPDLLVGRGKVLILQNRLEAVQTFPGTFDRPNDDPGGGLFRFELHRPVTVRSIALVDIDVGSAAEVLLTDERGGWRSYDVPAGWTGDRVVDRTSGVGTLDLTTLAPQPGFRGSATATESAGFLPARVIRIEVVLGGSGALDDLVLDPTR